MKSLNIGKKTYNQEQCPLVWSCQLEDIILAGCLPGFLLYWFSVSNLLKAAENESPSPKRGCCRMAIPTTRRQLADNSFRINYEEMHQSWYKNIVIELCSAMVWLHVLILKSNMSLGQNKRSLCGEGGWIVWESYRSCTGDVEKTQCQCSPWRRWK